MTELFNCSHSSGEYVGSFDSPPTRSSGMLRFYEVSNVICPKIPLICVGFECDSETVFKISQFL